MTHVLEQLRWFGLNPGEWRIRSHRPQDNRITELVFQNVRDEEFALVGEFMEQARQQEMRLRSLSLLSI